MSLLRDRIGVAQILTRKQLEEKRLSTLQGRLLAALETVGVFKVPDLQRKWRERFKEDLSRATAHRWYNRSKPPHDIEYEFLFKLAELTNHSAIWIALGKGQPTRWRPVNTAQAEVLDLFDRLDEQRREKWVSMGRDSLAAQEISKPTQANPYPGKVR